MKFALSKEHRDYFEKHGCIEFENFLTENQVKQFKQAIDEALSSRLQIPQHQLSSCTDEQLFLQGRDLWRVNSELQKIVSQPRFGQIASELIERKPLRLGYDQVLPDYRESHFDPFNTNFYTNYLKQTASLKEVSFLKGLLCGVMVCLQNKDREIPDVDPTLLEGPDIFPSFSGHVVFFKPQTPFNFQKMLLHPGQQFHLIVYSDVTTYYQLQPKDPHTHVLKHLGYVFNDKLTDRSHPIIYR